MIGEVLGVVEGDVFDSRQALHDAGIHGGIQAGIGRDGESIVLSGGYVDDKDDGDLILYTGQGGRDPNSGVQVADQELKRGNRLLAKHYREGNPIRVSRGSQLGPPFGPKHGYRYDGLYRIDGFWHEHGENGFLVYRYRLVKIDRGEIILAPVLPGTSPSVPQGIDEPRTSSVYTTRVIRNSAVANHVKEIYKHRCQISGVVLDTPSGRYAEGCHVKPVGRPHNGPDTLSNLLCLSPNIHVLFDTGAISMTDDFKLLGIEGRLELHPHHNLSVEFIRYHRKHVYCS